MTEDPADRFSRLLFTPLTHLLAHGRNVRSLDRLAEIAEGRVAIPGEEPQAGGGPQGEGSAENPLARKRAEQLRGAAAAAARGALAGCAGATAREVTRAIGSPRTERSVGGLMAVCAFVDAIAPNATVRLLGPLARVGWRKRDSRPLDRADALTQPAAKAELRTGVLASRPSILVKLRDVARIGR